MTAPPTVPPLRLATTRLATGPLVHYAEQGDPSCAGLLFIHGWPDSWYSWSRVLPLLAPARCLAYAVDQRGFGDSERPADGYSMDEFAADVVAFLDAVGLARATLVGHSFGSFIARRVAATRPERVAGLVLIGSAVRPDNDVTREVQQAAQSLEDPLPVEFVRDFQAGTLHIPVPEPFFEGLVAESLKAPARVWRQAFDNLLASDDAAQLGRIGVPTLIIWGDHDGLFPREQQAALAAAIPGARLTVYSETGHSPN
jgi:non-heme chloroperoxidase